jgi:hypothetical protein
MELHMYRTKDLPQPTRTTVENRARKDFPDTELSDILAILDHYGTQPYETEIHRVHMALLKLSNGRKDVLANGVESAKADYRDVLAHAEYPAQMALAPLKGDGSNAAAIEVAKQEDLTQYRDWLNGN